MKARGTRWRLLFALGLGLLLSASLEAKQIFAHYMPWFVAPPYSTKWGWHWTMNHYDPNTVAADGRRSIASRFYPEIGPYDSADPAVLEYHCLLMKLAGIDGVIVDWYGSDNVYDYALIETRTQALLREASRFGLQFALCYEDATIANAIKGGFLTASNALARGQDTLRYAATNYFNNPAYARLGGRPLLLNFGPQYFKKSTEWQAIFNVLTTSEQPAFFTEDNRLAIGQGAFNWPPMWLCPGNTGVLSATALNQYLDQFQQRATNWPAYIESAFPRFVDIYREAGLGYGYGVLEDAGGATFRATLERALANPAPVVQLVTWNDFGEGTVIEPTREFGTRDLVTVQTLRRQYVDSQFPRQADDLRLPFRLWQLRGQTSSNALAAAELDRVAGEIAQGQLASARLRLAGLEASAPAICQPTVSAGQLTFEIGGWLTTKGVTIQRATQLAPANWQPVQHLPANTNALRFTTPVEPQSNALIFRVVAGGSQ